jgi:hypothetical protein
VKNYFLLALALATGFISAGAVAVSSVTFRPTILNTPLLAQASGCPRAEVLALYETQNFNAYICQGFNNYIFYRGVSKSDGSSVNLTATKDAKGTWNARNSGILYRVNFTELVVTENGKVLLRERVISPP